MLSKNQEKLIKSLHNKKTRQKLGLCLVEGKKVLETAGNSIKYTFSKKDTDFFNNLVTTETPQEIAGVAKIPKYTEKDILSKKLIILLDGVQDPGNVGAIFRLCLGFNASLILENSVDASSSKVIRSSVGAIFQIPWVNITKKDINKWIAKGKRPVYRLEKRKLSKELNKKIKTPLILVAGSEGNGISDEIKGNSVFIKHDTKLESLNVGHALAIAMYLITE